VAAQYRHRNGLSKGFREPRQHCEEATKEDQALAAAGGKPRAALGGKASREDRVRDEKGNIGKIARNGGRAGTPTPPTGKERKRESTSSGNRW